MSKYSIGNVLVDWGTKQKGKKSPNYDPWAWGVGVGFHEQSVLGYAYALYKDGMDFDQMFYELYGSQEFFDIMNEYGIDINNDDEVLDFIFDTVCELFYELGRPYKC